MADRLVTSVEEADTNNWPGPLVVADEFGAAYWMKPGESKGATRRPELGCKAC